MALNNSIHPIKMDDDEKPSKLREFFYNRGIFSIWDFFPYSLKDWYYDHVRCIFRPQHKRLRKVIPRTWRDITCLIVTVNFEFIKSFYEDEYIDGHVDWTATEDHVEFAKWLQSAYRYITIERPDLEKQQDAAYPTTTMEDFFKGVSSAEFKKAYKEVTRLDGIISEKDTKVLTELVKRRDYFWT